MTGTSETTCHSTDLTRDMVELIEAARRLPTEQRRQIEPLLERVVDSTKRRRRILQFVQEALSQFRLDMKYLIFDLEATRRERDAYRDQLEYREDD